MLRHPLSKDVQRVIYVDGAQCATPKNVCCLDGKTQLPGSCEGKKLCGSSTFLTAKRTCMTSAIVPNARDARDARETVYCRASSVRARDLPIPSPNSSRMDSTKSKTHVKSPAWGGGSMKISDTCPLSVKAGTSHSHPPQKLSETIFWPKFQLTDLDNDGGGIRQMRRPPLVSYFLHFLPRSAEGNGLIETVRKI
jgi:hypothetical protein